MSKYAIPGRPGGPMHRGEEGQWRGTHWFPKLQNLIADEARTLPETRKTFVDRQLQRIQDTPLAYRDPKEQLLLESALPNYEVTPAGSLKPVLMKLGSQTNLADHS